MMYPSSVASCVRCVTAGLRQWYISATGISRMKFHYANDGQHVQDLLQMSAYKAAVSRAVS